jgi:hypothetical protein
MPLYQTSTLYVTAPIVISGALTLQIRQTLTQWWNALEAFRGHHFLLDPSGCVSNASMHEILKQWHPALENARGYHTLLAPAASYTTEAVMRTLLRQWWPALEAWRGQHFLQNPG